MLADVNGVKLAYSDSGEGSPVMVLLHGFPLNRSMWDGQFGSLRALGRVIAVDLRGFGASEGSDVEVLSMAQHADDVMALLDQLGVSEPVVVAGLSMGGYVALAFWRKYADRVRALVLADTRAGADTEEGRAGRLTLAGKVIEANSPAPAADASMPRMFAPTFSLENPIAIQLRAMMTGTTPQGVAGGLHGMAARPASLDLLPGINVPTLVIVGEQDVTTPPSEAQILADGIANAKLAVIPAAGHMSNMENPDEFNQALTSFISGLPALR